MPILPPSPGYSWWKGDANFDLATLPPWPGDLRPLKRQGGKAPRVGRASSGASSPESAASNSSAVAELDKRCAEIAAAGPGGRNDNLNRSAFAIGQLVGAGRLDESTATEQLTSAAQLSGLGLEEIRATILSGMTSGKSEPRFADPDVARINAEFALVLVGGKAAILKEHEDGSFEVMGVDAFQQWFANKRGPRGNKLGKHWLEHSERRQYQSIVFDPGRRDVPGKYNIWKGFKVEPVPGDCSKFLAHVRENVCAGNAQLYDWVMGWFAAIFQAPAKKVGTSLVLRGSQGVGKTKVGEVNGSLLGNHYKLVSHPRYITGRFNAHMTSCLLLHSDEGFWAGDRESEGKLKDLITGGTHFIEFKGKDSIEVPNHIRLLVSGNSDWLIPAGYGERRFAVLDVSDAHKEDHSYFAAIDAEMNNGGREALLHHLLNIDLSKINLRQIPETEALLDQKIATQTIEQAWWLDILWRGELPLLVGVNPATCPCGAVFESYIEHAKRQGARRRSIETQIGKFLRKHVPKLKKRPQDGASNGYEFPSLGDCRAAFAKALQHKIEWPEQANWTQPSSYM